MYKFLFAVLFLFSVTLVASYAPGERKFMDAGEGMAIDSKGRPMHSCENKNKMLEKSDCLRADGKLAKHCMVKELNKNEEYQDEKLSCGKDWLIDYACRDFVICSLKENGINKKDGSKKSSQQQGVR
jgi:hypothetical protein